MSHILNFCLVVTDFGQLMGSVMSVIYLPLLQIREPFSIMSIVKSPMGLMMGFMVIVMFLMPKMVENMGMHSILVFDGA